MGKGGGRGVLLELLLAAAFCSRSEVEDLTEVRPLLIAIAPLYTAWATRRGDVEGGGHACGAAGVRVHGQVPGVPRQIRVCCLVFL